ncbi:methylitaconate delta2-delta3-isomerase [Coprinopsis sp. MPI-PUGE-AT-0042]|nr:methylitaconate delta2-delta3-isomerase [Coprinopsis sp. MPI-PUGE-AT-0042]
MFRRALVYPTRFTEHYARKYATGPPLTPNPLPAMFLRGGTSKGIFINRSHLPSDPALWKPIFLGLMGSPDPEHGRQLNGMGGGVSSLSKICVVGRPSAETVVALRNAVESTEVDVEYTFVQVGIKDNSIDLSGNCGNLSSMVGAFALDAGLVHTAPLRAEVDGHPDTWTTTIRSFNTNTNKVISTTFPVAKSNSPKTIVSPRLDLPQASVAGVPGKASQILLQFHNPAGARTGKLLPTGAPTDRLKVKIPGTEEPTTISASLVDATNPTVLVSYNELENGLGLPLSEYVTSKGTEADRVGAALEAIRQAGATAMGLDPLAMAQPKIAILSSPSQADGDERADVVVHALSMGVLHKAIPMTVGLCLGVAAKVKGTLAWKIVQQSKEAKSGFSGSDDLVRILHPGGVVDVGAEFDDTGRAKLAQVVRTGRRLMAGSVYW